MQTDAATDGELASRKAVPPLTALRCFEVAAQFENFTVAAEHLFRAPSAISHQIRGLEEFLGTPLFLRTGKKVVLTDVGVAYYERIKDAFDLIAAATCAARLGGSDRESIRLSVAPSFGNAWLTPHLGDFFEHFPSIDLHVTTDQYPSSFAAREIDCEIRYSDQSIGKLEALPLCTERLVPLCSPAYLKQFASSGKMLECATFIHTKSRSTGWTEYFGAHQRQRSSSAKSLYFDRSTYSLDVASEGLGVVLESTILARDDLHKGRLIAPFGLSGIAGSTYQLVASTAESLRSDRIFAFYNWLRVTLSAESEIPTANTSSSRAKTPAASKTRSQEGHPHSINSP
ncbi:MAG: LysR substrate-binding domain-containing protein [Variovorax sp.]